MKTHSSLLLATSFFFLISSISNYAFSNDKSDQINDIAQSLGSNSLAEHFEVESIFGETIVTQDDRVIFYINGNQKKINNGRRSELAIDYPFEVGDEVVYQFEIFIPETFKSDPKGRWSVITQWHDQPNPELGESWHNFPGRSPPVALHDKDIDGKPFFEISYGDKVHPVPLIQGTWNKLKFHFHWKNDDSGSLNLLINGKDNIFLDGKNMLNAYQHYLKIGLYRHQDISIRNSIHFRKLKIEHKLD